MFDFILIYAFKIQLKIVVVIAFLREKSLEKFKKHSLEKTCKSVENNKWTGLFLPIFSKWTGLNC